MRLRVLSPLLAVCLAALAAGCSRGTPEAQEPAPETPAPEPETPQGPPPGGKRAACETEIAIQCADGLSDGCGLEDKDGAPLTNYHICVPAEETGAQPCEQELMRECGDGLVDACTVQPPAAATHICVERSEH